MSYLLVAAVVGGLVVLLIGRALARSVRLTLALVGLGICVWLGWLAYAAIK